MNPDTIPNREIEKDNVKFLFEEKKKKKQYWPKHP